jgi:hypothetical protein
MLKMSIACILLFMGWVLLLLASVLDYAGVK